jgi:predicted polyphosphate/ATP-dependent NAD kinase
MDVDEEAYRKGELRSELHGYAKSPYLPGLVQGAKQVFEDKDEEQAKRAIAAFITEVMISTPEILYILGPGSTTGAVAKELGTEKTLLGFDAVRSGKLVGSDLNEREMLLLLSGNKHARLVVSIIGAGEPPGLTGYWSGPGDCGGYAPQTRVYACTFHRYR